MAFSQDQFYVLLKPWRILTEKGLIGTFVTVYALALFGECLRYYNIYRTYNQSQTDRNTIRSTTRLRFHGINTIATTFEKILSYTLMLIAMTYNIWLFAAIVLGSATGYLVFTPLLERYMYLKEQSTTYELVTSL